MAFEKKYSDEVRDAAVRRVAERRQSEPGNRSILREVAEEFEVGEQSLRIWVKRLDDGMFDPGEAARLRQAPREQLLARIAELEAEAASLREDNEALKRASIIFAAEAAKQFTH
ncbi:transposase [Nocardioides carbamazepini]|uniref:transposase n=1 Tax=Nocardioides carbamazepini TaxID=2854259 RepID=UPI002149A908|nr:transposase [Nocardioides carbamazepini]MCR1785669.1 transposase [Nocardioides carbamazepini]